MAQLNPHSLCHSSHRKTTWKPPPNLSVVVVGQHVSSGTGWFQPVPLEIHTSSWKWNNSLLQLGPGDTIPPPPKKIKSKYQLFRCHLQDVPLLRNDGQTDIWSSYIRFSSGSFWLYPLQLWLKSRSIPDTALKIYCEGKIFVHFSAAHPGTQSPTLQANPIHTASQADGLQRHFTGHSTGCCGGLKKTYQEKKSGPELWQHTQVWACFQNGANSFSSVQPRHITFWGCKVSASMLTGYLARGVGADTPLQELSWPHKQDTQKW